MQIHYWEAKPSLGLTPYIETYWKLQTRSLCSPKLRSVFPDGCVDIIFNLGPGTVSVNGFTLKPTYACLAGTMTILSQVSYMHDSCLIGIRFKPGALPAFYPCDLAEIRDQFVDFNDPKLITLLDADDLLNKRLDNYYEHKKIHRVGRTLPVVRSMYATNGRVSIQQLAQRHHLSSRTLERLFKADVGIAPKELSSIIRLQALLRRLKQDSANTTLAQLALEMGYYDQSHLTNELKRFTGRTPGQF